MIKTAWEIKNNRLHIIEGEFQNWLRISGKSFLSFLLELKTKYPLLEIHFPYLGEGDGEGYHNIDNVIEYLERI